LKYGNDNDIEKLPPVAASEKSNKIKHGGWNVQSTHVRKAGRNGTRKYAAAVIEDFEHAFRHNVHGPM